MTLGQLAEEVRQEEEQQTGGAVDYTARRKSNLDKVPGWELRPGAPKMQLRPKEEALLPLVRSAAHTWLQYHMQSLASAVIHPSCWLLDTTAHKLCLLHIQKSVAHQLPHDPIQIG